MKTILITGGTGTVGRAVVQRLLDTGHDVRVLSRRTRNGSTPYSWTTGDLSTGDGLDAAVVDVDAIIHCASGYPRFREDVQGTRNLIEAARRTGSPHLVYISIVGVDRVPFSYYRTKLEIERLIGGSGLPWTVLRVTQFHDLVRYVADRLSRLPVMPVPAAISVQPVDVRDVAVRLVDLAVSEPAGRAPDMGGPQIRTARDLARTYLQAVGRRRLVVPIPVPGRVFRGYRDGGHLAPDHADGRITFDEFLAEHPEAVRGPDPRDRRPHQPS
jgi:uncharacterized protein YbjT (DUF2867 family)